MLLASFCCSPCLNVTTSVFSEIEFKFATKQIYVDPEEWGDILRSLLSPKAVNLLVLPCASAMLVTSNVVLRITFLFIDNIPAKEWEEWLHLVQILHWFFFEEKKARSDWIQCFVSFKGLSLYAAETALPKSEQILPGQ